MKQQRDGFILVLTLLILSIAVLLVNQLYVVGTTSVFFDRAMIDREKAKTLALGAVRLAENQLAIVKKEKETSKEKQTKEVPEKDKYKQEQKFLERILPALNRWQTVELKEKLDGIAGTIKLCISCEDGKLNINQLYDFEKKKFIPLAQLQQQDAKTDKKTDTTEMQTLFASIAKLTGVKELFAPFEKFLKERHYRLNDTTELLKRSEFQQAFSSTIFYEPPEKQERQTTQKRAIYLMDLFTIFSGTAKLEPWLLSDSVAAVLGFTRAQADDKEKRTKELPALLKEFKPTVSLEKEWNTLFKPLYGKEFKSLTKETQAMLQTTFEPKTFSVLIHATVGAITQKLYVILQRTNQESYEQFTVQRLYWL